MYARAVPCASPYLSVGGLYDSDSRTKDTILPFISNGKRHPASLAQPPSLLDLYMIEHVDAMLDFS
jgi:hypothetical protein